MSNLHLIDNSEADWSGKEYYYDDQGNPHKQHLKFGRDYELSDGTLLDDVDALQNGYIFDNEYGDQDE